MGKIFSHIIPNVEEWPINKFSEHRAEFIQGLNDLVLQRLKTHSKRSIDELLAKSIYLESHRIKTSPWKVDPANDAEYWKSLGVELNDAQKSPDKDAKLDKILKRIINRYNEEIVGSFNPKTFYFARRLLLFLFRIVYNKFSGKGQSWFWGNKKNLLEKIKITGFVEETRALFKKGTVVIVPTHFSNIDSVMIGYTVDTLGGMPAFAYGAGLNLFNNEIVAYFINRMGAYRIDRRKKNPIYLECLTSMASYSLYNGLNNTFFPGGTRSRSGAIEDKLKYGLLSSAIDAQRMIFENKKESKIFVVPLVMSYNFVFEGKSLIEQHLSSIGKEKYQRSRDSKPSSKWSFLRLFFKKESELVFSFGEPMDVLGNMVDENGQSIDKDCAPIDLEQYFILDNELSENTQRESVYTRILAEKVLQSYFRNNVVLASHLTAFVAFNLLLNQRKDLNFFAILKLHPKEFDISYTDFKSNFQAVLVILKSMESKGQINLSAELFGDIDKAIEYGIQTLGAYHVSKVLGIDKDKAKIFSEDLKLLYFYSNRLLGYDLETKMNWDSKDTFRYLDKIKGGE
jgi:glycerol-3-phosphate O-acyltransferase